MAESIILQLGDPLLTPERRRVLLSMGLCMPCWLWPEPNKHGQRHLPPQSRPRLLQEQAQHFLRGDLAVLLAGMQAEASDTEPACSPPRVPGLLTPQDANRLLQAGRQGRLTTAWKQLFSYGVAAANATTERLFLQKWLPAPLFPAEVPGRYLSAAESRDLLPEAAIQQAAKTLPKGSAMDSLGWSHEAC